MANGDSAVVYVDLLGFSALTRKDAVPHERLLEDMPLLYGRPVFDQMRRGQPPPGAQAPTLGLIRFSGRLPYVDRRSSGLLLQRKQMMRVGPVGNGVLGRFPRDPHALHSRVFQIQRG